MLQQQQTYPGVSGLCDKVLVVMGGYSSGSCEKLPEAPPCPPKAMPDGSNIDPQLAKAEPISPGASTSGITDLRRGKEKEQQHL